MRKKLGERRKFKRFDCAVGVECKLPGRGRNTQSSTTKNVSRDGVSFPLLKKLKKGAKLKIKLGISEDAVPFFVHGKVAWVSRAIDKKTHTFEAGVKFTRIDAPNRAELLDYAYEQWAGSLGKDKIDGK